MGIEGEKNRSLIVILEVRKQGVGTGNFISAK
jgi:hypothetical protein